MPRSPNASGPGWRPLLLGLFVVGLVLAPSASGAQPLDTVNATGTADIGPGQGFPTPAQYTNVSISAQSGTSGQNPSGTASFTLVANGVPGSLTLSGPVTCLHVLGPDNGGGTPTSPTTAVLTFTPSSTFTAVEVTLLDRGGGGADTINTQPVSTPTECSAPFSGSTGTFTNGRATVFDAPVLPTSKDQCKHGGWRNYPPVQEPGRLRELRRERQVGRRFSDRTPAYDAGGCG